MTLTKIDDRGLKYPLEFRDNEELRIGENNKTSLRHNGSHFFLNNNNGNIYLRLNTSTNGIIVRGSNGAVDLYYNGSKKLETTTNGVLLGDHTVASIGTLTKGVVDLGGQYATSAATPKLLLYNDTNAHLGFGISSNQLNVNLSNSGFDFCVYNQSTERFRVHGDGAGVDIPDNSALRLGDSQDLRFFHDGTNSFIRNNTAALIFQADQYRFRDKDDGDTFANFIHDAQVELYYNGVKKFETTVNGITVSGDAFFADNNKFLAGNSNDLQIFHDGTHSYLYNLTGELKNRAAIWKVVNAANTEIQIKATENAGVELYHDNVKRLETNGVGVKVSGDILVGNGTDLEIKNDSANETLAKFINNAAVELYYNNVRKLETTSNGIKISNSPSSLTSGAIKINTDFANYGHIVVRDSNVNTLAAISVENANDGNNEINYIYRSVDLASSAWANARMSALSHRFQITSDTPLQNEKLVIDANGILVSGNTNSSSSVTGVRVNTDIINYGGVSVRDASNSTQSNHIACFQAENAGTGTDETNVVTRSVNRNSNNWANAKYAAKSHMFTVNNTIDAGIKVRIDSDGLKLGGETAAANALNDYEEGTWTPDLQFGGSNSGITYSSRYGHYVKIGNQVTVIARINLSSKGSASGNAKIEGLPFATKSITGTQMSIGSIWFSSGGMSIQGNKSSLYYMVARTDGNAQTFVEPKNVGYTSEDSVGDSDFGNSGDMTFSITYLTE